MVKKILIIDDEQDFVDTTSFSLENSGFTVLASLDGLSGIEKAKKQKPDIILLDLMMPDIDGYEIAKRLKEDKLTANIPIIVLTAVMSADLEQKIQQSKASDYMFKPCDLDILTQKIEKIVNK